MGRRLGRTLRGAGKALGGGVKVADDLIERTVAGRMGRETDAPADPAAASTPPHGEPAEPHADQHADPVTDLDPVEFDNGIAKDGENRPIRITKHHQMYPVDDGETSKILRRLDPDESIVMSVRQSRIKPGGAAIINPHTIFATEKRVIIRSPTRLGLGENIEVYDYSVIKGIHIEKGLLSSSVVFFVEGMSEISKQDRKWKVRGRTAAGTIDAIPKAKAEALHRYVWAKIREAREQGANVAPAAPVPAQRVDPLKLLQTRYVNGEISRQEFLTMKEDLGL